MRVFDRREVERFAQELAEKDAEKSAGVGIKTGVPAAIVSRKAGTSITRAKIVTDIPSYQSPWLTVKQAAAYLQCGPRLLYDAVEKHQCRAARIGGKRAIRFRREWLDEYGERCAEPQEVGR